MANNEMNEEAATTVAAIVSTIESPNNPQQMVAVITAVVAVIMPSTEPTPMETLVNCLKALWNFIGPLLFGGNGRRLEDTVQGAIN